MVVDIGGGSTEFVWRNREGMIEGLSFHLGSVRMTESFLGDRPSPSLPWTPPGRRRLLAGAVNAHESLLAPGLH